VVQDHGSGRWRSEVRLRLHWPDQQTSAAGDGWHGSYFETVMADREREADEFYAALAPDDIGEEHMRVLRQSCAGLIWSKQMYPYRVARWLDGDPGQPAPPPGHRHGRNSGWRHLDSFDVLAMPDLGSIRGLPLGTSRFTPLAGRIWIRRLRNTNCWCCCGNGFCIRMALSQRTNGVLTMSILRSMPSLRSGCL
jgi:hypothetical protein